MRYFKLLAFVLLFGGTASAQEFLSYDPSQFKKLSAQKKQILLDFHAEWCSICRKQEKILREIAQKNIFPDLTVFKVDIEKYEELREEYNVKRQSTLVILNNGRETYRSVAETDKGEIIKIIKFGISQ